MVYIILYSILGYLFSYSVSRFSLNNTLVRIKNKHDATHVNIKKSAKLLKVLCWCPGYNTIFAIAYIISFMYGFLFKTTKK